MPDLLPVERIRKAFDAAATNGHVVVEAPTGSGKSTRLPLWCAQHGRVLVVEPRRLACRALAHHLAELQGSRLGKDIGYAVRFDTQFSPVSRVVFVTPGVALRWLPDSDLNPFSTVSVAYEPERRRITLERCGGKRRTLPMPKELPLWRGWSVRYRDGSRIVTIR